MASPVGPGGADGDSAPANATVPPQPPGTPVN
jgi:hypothetical protein